MNSNTSQRTAGWTAIRRGHRARPLEWIVERCIFAVSFSTIAVVFLIFASVAREAWPVAVQSRSVNSALVQPVLPSADLDKLPPETVRQYLGMEPKAFAAMDRETLLSLMEVREEAAREIPENFRKDPDAGLNTTRWEYLLSAHQWTDYQRPEYIWQPVGQIRKFNIVPLLIGTLKTTIVGLLFAVPLALGAAIFVSQLAPPSWKEWIKPAIELLSGIPSVVMGTFALLVMATFLQRVFGYETRLNAFVAGIALGFSVIPLVFSIAEDALTSVPRSYTQAALAVGASQWQAAYQIVLPAALPGVFAAVVLGFGRAIGETMTVLLVCSASVLSWSVFDSARSITATIAAEMAEAVAGGPHYRVLFLLGSLLFAVTFLTNFLGDLAVHRFRQRLEGGK